MENPVEEVQEPHCIHHPREEVYFPRSQYCHLCHWAMQVIETQASILANSHDGRQEDTLQKRYFFLCPNRHAFTSRLSGADAICNRCRDKGVKNSVASCGCEEVWVNATELGPELRFEKPELAHASAFMVRVDPNALDLRKVYEELKDSFKQENLRSLYLVCNDILSALRNARLSKSSSINQLCYRANRRESVYEELHEILLAVQLLSRLAGGSGLEVFYKKEERLEGFIDL